MATMTQKARADGTILHRVQFSIGNGKRSSESFNTFEEAEAFMRKGNRIGFQEASNLRTKLGKSNNVATLSECLDLHLTKSRVENGTAEKYRQMRRTSGWGETIGEYPVDTITKDDVQDWVYEREGTHSKRHPDRLISPKTIKNEYTVIHLALGYAMRTGLITKNPCDGVVLPKLIPHDMVAVSHEDYMRLYDATNPHYQPLVAFLAGTGLRFGEAAALRWRNVIEARPGHPEDLVIIRVRAAMKQGTKDQRRVEGQPKTRASRREVSITQPMREALGPRGKTDEFVFSARTGATPLPDYTFNKAFGRAREVSGVNPDIRVHDLRHYHASMLLAGGVPAHMVQARLGHEDITTTIKVYSYLPPDAQSRMASAAALVVADNPSLKTLEPVRDPDVIDGEVVEVDPMARIAALEAELAKAKALLQAQQ